MKKNKPKKTNDIILRRLESLEDSLRFQELVSKYRKQEGIPENGCKAQKELSKHLYENARKNDKLILSINSGKDLEDGIGLNDILFELEIPFLYKGFIESYIYFGSFYKNSVFKDIAEKNEKVKIYLVGNNNYSIDDDFKYDLNTKIILEIGADTTLPDIEDIWTSEVKVLQRKMLGYKDKNKFSSLKNLKIDKKINKLRSQKVFNSEIVDQINYEFPNKDPLMPSEVSSRNARFKRKNK